MRILDGEIPKEKIWRVLVLFSPDQEVGLTWHFGVQLAEATGGEAVAAVIIPRAESENALQSAREVLDRARSFVNGEKVVHTLVVEADDFHRALVTLVEEADIDLLLADGDNSHWRRLDRLPCAVSVIRGAAHREFQDEWKSEERERQSGDGSGREMAVRSILVPTAGGPNTALALSLLLPLEPEVDITSLYVVPEYLGKNEVAHGQARLRQLANFVDGGEHIERRVIEAESPTRGIIEEASGPYDLVIIGASRQSTFDRALFGDVVGAVVRESKTPVAVFWEPASTIGNIGRDLAWRLQNVVPRLSLSERTEIYVRVRRSARPDIDYFILIGLSSLIAALGLLLDSAAVVIGAMLVAPLMSPMIGAGMAIVMGNPRFLRLTIGAIGRGVLLSIGLSILAGFLQAGQPLTPQILARTQPTLLDLGVAVFAGLAGAYALGKSDVAAALPGVAISAALVPPLSVVGIALASGHFRESLGALLLFTTNLTAIVAAGVFVFVNLGFRPSQTQKARRAVQQQSVRVALILLVLITVVLGVTTLRLASEASLNARIHEVAELRTNQIEGVEFAELEIENLTNRQEPLTLELTVRSTYAIPHSTADTLRNQIGADLQPYLDADREIAMRLTVIRVTNLDPEVPPTPTPTPTLTLTPTPGPSETPTSTPSPTQTPSPTLVLRDTGQVTATATLTVTLTPTLTLTSTPAPAPTGDSTPTPADDSTPTPTGDSSPTPADDSTPTPTGDSTPTPTEDLTPTLTATLTLPLTPTGTFVLPPTPTATLSLDATPGPTETSASSPSSAQTPTLTPSAGLE